VAVVVDDGSLLVDSQPVGWFGLTVRLHSNSTIHTGLSISITW